MKKVNSIIIAMCLVVLPWTVYSWVVDDGTPTYTPLIPYVVDSSVSDQGAATSQGNRSIKDFVDSIGSSKKATIYLPHTGGSNETTYAITTSESAGSNITFKIEPGAIIQPAASISLTIYSPENIIAQPTQKIIDTTNNSTNPLLFTRGGTIYPPWLGALGDASTDDNTAVNTSIAALNCDGGILYFPIGTYKTSAVFTTITTGCKIAGSDPQNAIVRTSSTTADIFVVESDDAVIFEDLKIDGDGITKTDGSLISFSGTTPGTTYNEGSQIRNCRLAKGYRGLEFIDASCWHVDHCYIVTNRYEGICIKNTSSVDTGASSITSCIFNNTDTSTTFAIAQYSAGGLRIVGNKILNHKYGYMGNYTENTGSLIISANSFETQGTANIYLNETGGSFSRIAITGNQFTTHSAYGIQINDIQEFSISGNTLRGNASATHFIKIESGSDGYVGENCFYASGGTTTGISIASGVTGVQVGHNSHTGLTTYITDASAATLIADRFFKVDVDAGDGSGTPYTGMDVDNFPAFYRFDIDSLGENYVVTLPEASTWLGKEVIIHLTNANATYDLRVDPADASDQIISTSAAGDYLGADGGDEILHLIALGNNKIEIVNSSGTWTEE